MSKKITIPIVVAVILALVAGAWVTFDVFAKEGSSIKDRLLAAKKGLAQVTSISDQQFSVQRLNGQEFIILVDENTKFLDREKTILEINDLQIDQWVIVAAKQNEEGEHVARLVILLPDYFDPTRLSGAVGSITDVDLDGKTISLLDQQNEIKKYEINDETHFLGEIQDFTDLETGMRALVRVQTLEDDSLLALSVRANYPLINYIGEISDVDLSNNLFSLHSRRGDQELTFQVDETTRFKGKDDLLQSLDDLQPGMVAFIVARSKSEESDQLIAKSVRAVEKDQLPNFDIKKIGEVVSAQDSNLTIKTRDGEEFTFQVIEETRWVGRGIQVSNLEDLQPGMWVIVGAAETTDGEYQAKLVIAGYRRTTSTNN